MPDDIVPFGKYKGRPVDEMLADGGYMEWLGAQPWFRERFGHLIDAHDRQEAEATPVHNRLQALFLDPHYQAAFVKLVASPKVENALAAEAASRARIVSKIARAVDRALALADVECVATGQATLVRLSEIGSAAAVISAAFEAPQDVVLTVRVSVAVAETELTVRFYVDTFDPAATLRIEIKPTIGDDYPVVLRQMMRNGSKHLFIGRYEGVGVTEEQFVAIFKASGKTVVFKGEVDRIAAEMRRDA